MSVSQSFTKGFGIKFEVNQADVAALQNHVKQLQQNLQTRVPAAITQLLNSTKAVAEEITHKQKGTLAAGWQVNPSSREFTLINLTSYAQKEFTRGGEKFKGRPPYGPHNVLPRLFDMINANIEAVIMEAMGSGLSR